MTTVEVDKDLCVMCGMCVGICPDVFKEDDGGKSEVIPDSDATLPCVREAADSCPSEAIIITE